MKFKNMKVADYIRIAESVILVAITVVLIMLAIVLLADSVLTMGKEVLNGTVAHASIEILNSVLLVMMIMEIVYTVKMSLESHSLCAEPFLIIGAIAAVRRMLVITAEGTHIELTNPSAFRLLLMELGLLGFLVMAIAFSVYILKRSSKFVRQECNNDDKGIEQTLEN